MWQLVDAAYKAYEICHFVGLKKRKVTAIVCVFYEKRRLTRRERLKSALHLRLKKRKTFFGKTEIFENFHFFGKCRIVPKNAKGALGFIKIYSVVGDSFETLKNFEKVAQCRKKVERGTL